MTTLPGGTVTFAFTDIEGSTRLLQDLGDEAYGRVSGDHRRLASSTRTGCPSSDAARWEWTFPFASGCFR